MTLIPRESESSKDFIRITVSRWGVVLYLFVIALTLSLFFSYILSYEPSSDWNDYPPEEPYPTYSSYTLLTLEECHHLGGWAESDLGACVHVVGGWLLDTQEECVCCVESE